MQAMLPAVVSQEQHATSSKAHTSLGLQRVDRVVAEEGLSKQGGDVGHWGARHEATQSPHLLFDAGSTCWRQAAVAVDVGRRAAYVADRICWTQARHVECSQHILETGCWDSMYLHPSWDLVWMRGNRQPGGCKMYRTACSVYSSSRQGWLATSLNILYLHAKTGNMGL